MVTGQQLRWLATGLKPNDDTEPPNKIKCPYCDKKYKSSKAGNSWLKRHIKEAHPSQPIPERILPRQPKTSLQKPARSIPPPRKPKQRKKKNFCDTNIVYIKK